MANIYECMFLLDTTKVGGDVGNAERELHGILEKHQAEILSSNPWDERRLAYQIGHQKKGLYFLTYFRTDGKNVVEIERDCKLSEMIIRQLILKIDPKLVDTMLAAARGEMPPGEHDEAPEGQPPQGNGEQQPATQETPEAEATEAQPSPQA